MRGLKALAILLVMALISLSAHAKEWERLPGKGSRITVAINGSAYLIGTNRLNDGFDVYRWSESKRNWESFSTSRHDQTDGAVLVAVDPGGLPYITTISERIFRSNGKGGWQEFPGNAWEMAIGLTGAIWSIGTTPTANDGAAIYHFTSKGWERVQGSGAYIAVDPKGLPWVIKRGGGLVRGDGKGGWQEMGRAKSIAISANGSVWIAGMDDAIYNWTGKDWAKTNGVGTNVAVDISGRLWLINASGEIWRENVPSPKQNKVKRMGHVRPAGV